MTSQVGELNAAILGVEFRRGRSTSDDLMSDPRPELQKIV